MSRLGAVGIFVWLAASALHAQIGATLRAPVYQIQDRGQDRVFEVARDEIHVQAAPRSPGRKVVPLPVAATAEDARKVAEDQARTQGNAAELVLYESGKPRSEATRRLLTKNVLARLRPGSNGEAIAAAYGLNFRGPPIPGSEYTVFETPKTGGALEAANALRTRGDIVSAEPQLARQQQKRFTANDPLFTQQWHLLNTGQSGSSIGIDANVSPVWETFRGTGVRVGIVDDGLQLTHPDLLASVDTVNDRDWNDGTPNDPSPVVTSDFHGTACAGVTGARGGNGLGLSGAAPDATVVGLRLIAEPTVDQQEAEAMLWMNDLIAIKSNSWGPEDDGRTLEAPGPLTRAAFETAVQTGRGGLGTILVWAGGNGGTANDNSNYDGYANAPETIAVGAITNLGKRASYSESGANLVVSAPSSGGTLRIVTTDLIGNSGYNASTISGELSDRDYTNDFGGTSAAAPVVSGCIALMLEANPGLGWRDVQEILMRSARQVDPANADWITNTAGFRFNHNFGAGLVDAEAAVLLAQSWTNLTTRTSLAGAQTGLNVAIPDNNAAGTKLQFDLSSANIRTEHVTVKVSVTHASRGQLAITLTSPTGVQSRLAEKRADTGDNYSNWTFSTVRNWGEDSQGVWTLTIADLISGVTGKVTSATLTVFGTPAGALDRPPSISAAALNRATTMFEDQTLRIEAVTATDPDGDPITFTYQWQESRDNLTYAPIATATSNSLIPAGLSGHIVRCLLTPNAAGKSGTSFLTAGVAVNRPAPSTARHGVPFSYDSDLVLFTPQTNVSRSLIINEFTQGSGGSKEWVEMLVLHQSDLRGFTLSDRIGTYVTFSNNAVWSEVPAGTLLVIYNGNERDSALPSDRIDLPNRLVVVPHTNTTAFSTRAWGGINNSGSESLIVRDAAGSMVDALSINNENIYDPKLANVGSQRAAAYQGDSDWGADVTTNWKIFSYLSATPGAGNSTANSQLITSLRTGVPNAVPKYRLSTSSDLVPGLRLDEGTGLLHGTPDVPAGELFKLRIERNTTTESVTQSFDLLVVGEDGNGRVPLGQSWTLSSNTTLPANLNVQGTIDTNGHALTVLGVLTMGISATVLNDAGLIGYGQLVGNTLPGAYTLAADPINDTADPDGDQISNLVEFALGSDPATPDIPVYLQQTIQDGFPQYTMSFPAGAVGVSRTIEVSADLVTWQSGPPSAEVVSDVVSAGIRTVTVRDGTKRATSFGRVRISR